MPEWLKMVLGLVWSMFLMGMLDGYETTRDEIAFGLYTVLAIATVGFVWLAEGAFSGVVALLVFGSMGFLSRVLARKGLSLWGSAQKKK